MRSSTPVDEESPDDDDDDDDDDDSEVDSPPEDEDEDEDAGEDEELESLELGCESPVVLDVVIVSAFDVEPSAAVDDSLVATWSSPQAPELVVASIRMNSWRDRTFVELPGSAWRFKCGRHSALAPPPDTTPPRQARAGKATAPREVAAAKSVTARARADLTPETFIPASRTNGLGHGVERIAEATIARLDAATQAAFMARVERAAPGSSLARLATTLSLLDLLQPEQSLRTHDREAHRVLSLRKPQLESLAEELFARAEISEAFEGALSDARDQVLGSSWQQRATAHANYVLSPQFLQTLPTREPQRSSAVQAELMKLSAIDPDLARDTGVAFVIFEAARNPARVIAEMSEGQRVDAIFGALTFLVELAQADASGLGVESGDRPVQASPLIQNFSSGRQAVWAVTLARSATQALRERGARLAAAQAISQAYLSDTFSNDVGSYRGAHKLMQNLRAQGKPGAANLVEHMLHGTAAGRGFSLFAALIAVAGLSTLQWTDQDGSPMLDSWLFAFSAAAGIATNLPTAVRFARQDFRLFMAFVAGQRDARNVRRIRHAGFVLQNGKHWWVWVAKWAGPVGDILGVLIAGRSMSAEIRAEDAAGAVSRGIQVATNIVNLAVFARMVVFGVTTTVLGAPLAAISIVVGLGALLYNVFFAESALTGTIREHLRSVGISDAEEDVVRRMTVKVYREEDVPADFLSPESMSPLIVEHRRQALAAGRITDRRTPQGIAAQVRSATLDEKLLLFNAFLDGDPSSRDEEAMVLILQDCDRAQTLAQLLDRIDTALLAEKLERADQASTVLTLMLISHTRSNTDPTSHVGPFVQEIARAHRQEVILQTFRTDRVRLRAYQRLSADVIRTAVTLLMRGMTSASEERAIMQLLSRADDPQFEAVFTRADPDWSRRLRNELTRSDWTQISRRLRSLPNPRLGHIARQVDSIPRGRTPGHVDNYGP